MARSDRSRHPKGDERMPQSWHYSAPSAGRKEPPAGGAEGFGARALFSRKIELPLWRALINWIFSVRASYHCGSSKTPACGAVMPDLARLR